MNILHDGYRVHAAYERQASSYDQAMILYRLLGLSSWSCILGSR
jgi:hypothetical protein